MPLDQGVIGSGDASGAMKSHAPKPSNGGKIRSKTSGQCSWTISLESEFVLQMAAYRSADCRLVRFCVSTSSAHSPKRCVQAAVPFEVIDERPMEVAFDLPVEIHGAPDLVKVLREVSASDGILARFDAVLGDVDGQVGVGAHRPAHGVIESLRQVCDEAGLAQVRTGGIAHTREELFGVEQVEPGGVGTVVVQAQVVLRAA